MRKLRLSTVEINGEEEVWCTLSQSGRCGEKKNHLPSQHQFEEFL
jgi:hypothetical protein